MNENTLKNFFTGLISPEEEKELFQWINNDPDNMRQFITARKEYDQLLLAENTIVESSDLETEYNDLKQRIKAEENYTKEINFEKRKTKIVSILKRFTGYAAIIVLGIAAWQWINPYFFHKIKDTPTVNFTEVRVPNGSRTAVLLPDSSLVWVNAGTQLKYPDRFSASTREVWLTGEACFEVTHDDNSQFIVHTSGLDIKVFGTTFNVNAYENNCAEEVTLLEGSVQLKPVNPEAFDEMFLVPGEQAVHGKDGINIRKVDVSHVTTWRDGSFYFDNESFGSICKQLERNFDVEIQIRGDQLKHSTFTGQFTDNESIEKILSVIGHDKRIGYTMKEKKIIIYEKF